jgi:hypothetical protein
MANLEVNLSKKDLQVNLRDRLMKAFGISGKEYLLPDSQSLNQLKKQLLGENKTFSPSLDAVSVLEKSPDYISPMSVFGTPLFDEIELQSYNGGLLYAFDYDPIVDLRRRKKTTETVLSSGDSVIEVAGVEPVDITIRGVLWNPAGSFPERELSRLIQVFETDTVFKVVSRLFNYHRISHIYIKELDTPALEGYEDTQPFVITARSIKPFSLIIQQNLIQ